MKKFKCTKMKPTQYTFIFMVYYYETINVNKIPNQRVIFYGFPKDMPGFESSRDFRLTVEVSSLSKITLADELEANRGTAGSVIGLKSTSGHAGTNIIDRHGITFLMFSLSVEEYLMPPSLVISLDPMRPVIMVPTTRELGNLFVIS